MKIILNNRPEDLPFEEISVAKLIHYKNFTFKLLVTKINGRLVKKENRNDALVKEGDNVMIMHLISGG